MQLLVSLRHLLKLKPTSAALEHAGVRVQDLMGLIHGLAWHSWHLNRALIEFAASLHHFLEYLLFSWLGLSLILLADNCFFTRMVSDREKVGLGVESAVGHRVVALLSLSCGSIVILQTFVDVE